MILHQEISKEALFLGIKNGKVRFAGNRKLKIYGHLGCSSGKRMRRENRIFFASIAEAVQQGYRPCGHCMKQAYQLNRMDLFSSQINEKHNYLPKDGEVNYYGAVLSKTDADFYLNCLLETIQWKHDEAIIFGKHITTKRKVAWYGDRAFAYTYSNTTKQALPWTKALLQLKTLVEEKTGESFNSCLLNLYHNGSEGMAWHSDGETDLKKNGAIASVSLGAERKFAFKHKTTKEKISIFLAHGSLLVMKGITQSHWLHHLPPTTLVQSARINLTFRTIENA